MLKYVKTSISPKLYLTLLRYELKINKSSVKVSNKVNNTLVQYYHTNLTDVLNAIIKSVRCANVKKNLLQVYILDSMIGEHKLSEIIRFLDYGSLDVSAAKIISKYVNEAILLTKSYLGGI